MTRFPVVLKSGERIVALATHEGPSWRVWGARTATGGSRALTREERAEAEREVTAQVARTQQAEMFAQEVS